MTLIVITLAVPDRTGSSRMQAAFAEALIRRGHRVRVIHGPAACGPAGAEHSLLEQQRDLGIETRLVAGLRRPFPYVVYRQLVAAASGADAIVGFHQRDRAAAMWVAANLAIPGIVAAQNQHRFSGSGMGPPLKKWYYGRRLAQGMQLAVCTSTVVRDEMVTMFDVAPATCTVLPNGIPKPSASAVDIDRARSSRPVANEFIAIGRLDVQKGYDTLLRAWAAARLGPNVRLRIVGGTTPGNRSEVSAEHELHLRRLAARLGIDDSVVFHGPSDDVATLLTRADVFVHSAHWEGPALPLAVLEAMNAGLPVITTDCSGWPPGFIQGVHGRIVGAQSVEDLRSAICEMSRATPAERRRFGLEARRLASTEYDIESVGDRFVDLVESALGRDER